MDNIKVLVADGQRLFADSLAVALRAFPGVEVVDALPLSGQEAVRAATKHRPDVVVLDYWIGGMSGPAAVAAMLRNVPKTKIVMLGWFMGPPDESEAREAGAHALIRKSVGTTQLADTIRAVVSLAPDTTGTRASEPAPDTASSPSWRVIAALSPREIEVLELLFFSMTPAQIAAELGIATRTVGNLIQSVLTKTGARSQKEAIALTIGPGRITPATRDRLTPDMPSIPPGLGDRDASGYPTVLVADGQALFADVLARGLRAWWLPVIDEYPAAPDAIIEAVSRHRPEVVLLDYWLEGAATTAAISRVSSETIVIALSWLFSPGRIREGLQAGVAGFLPKYVNLPIVAAAVRRAAAGDPLVFGESLAAWLGWLHDTAERSESARSRFGSITPRELQIVRALCAGRSISEIAAHLEIREATARVHVRSLLKKTGARSQTDLVGLARLAHVITV